MASKSEKAELLVDAKWLAAHRGDAAVVLVDTRAPAD